MHYFCKRKKNASLIINNKTIKIIYGLHFLNYRRSKEDWFRNSSCRVSRYRLYERNVRNLSIDKNI